MSFTPAQVALLDRNPELVEARRLFKVDFRSASYRFVEGNIPVNIGGIVWEPAHDWITASPLESAKPLEAVPATYNVGRLTPGLVMAALHDKAEWYRAPIQQMLQVLSDVVPVGPAISLHSGFIEHVERVEDHAELYLEIRAESLFARRNFTPLGEYTDRDQQRRYPGDLGAAFAASLVGKILKGWLRA